MIDRLPNYYRKSKTVKDFYSVVQTILDKVSEDISDEDKRLLLPQIVFCCMKKT